MADDSRAGAGDDFTLSVALMGIAGSLMIGNFAAFGTFVAMARAGGDRLIVLALIAATAALIASIVAGGWRRYNGQAVLGALGVVLSLASPVVALVMPEPPARTDSARLEALETRVQALEGAGGPAGGN